MYAVIKSGGKQHRIQQGDLLNVELLSSVEPGQSINFTDVLLVADGEDIRIGSPFVENATVTADVLSHERADKIKIVKFRRRKHSRKQMGHRQWFTHVKITAINL